ncbi:MAG TPA: hypothetical protein VNZ22_21875 [Bacillota bacterium]|nr:hypothetical protein [Bacillota bacterium]
MKTSGSWGYRGLWTLLLALLLAGCATARVDWKSRIGNYTYDQAVLELGPPDKYAKLNDGTAVAEWLTRHSYTYASSPFAAGMYPGWYGPPYAGYADVYTSPSYYLRLIFSPDGRLTAWKEFAK